MNILQTKNIRKIYTEAGKDKTVLNNINLTINAGEYLGIYGASGSGKTTLLKILAGLIKPDSGEIYFEGNPAADQSSEDLAFLRRHHIGTVFSELGLLEELTVEQNILLPFFLDKREIDSERFSIIIKNFGIKNKLDSFPSMLSSGEKQRVMIARALITKPSLILLDEPVSNLDRENRKKVMDLLDFSHISLGETILIVSHDEEIISRTERIICLSDGEIIHDKRIKGKSF